MGRSKDEHTARNAGVLTTEIGERIQEWDAAIQAWLSSRNPDDGPPEDTATLAACLHALDDMLTIIAEVVAPRDEWEHFRYGSAAVIVLRSKKLMHNFSFGVYDWIGQYSLSSEVAYPRHLRSMSDDFWRAVLEMATCGVDFEPNHGLSKKSKSVIFRMVEEHVCCANNPDADDSDPFIDFGSLDAEWPIGTQFQQVFYAAAEAFKRIYRVNYLLYRNEYICAKSREKRQPRKG